MIFDDYDGFGVKLGVDGFVDVVRKGADDLRVLWVSNQFIIQKLDGGDETCR